MVESLAHNVTRRLLRQPLQRLRAAAGSEQEEPYRAALEHLFGGADSTPDN